jgi:RNA polymerase sigma-70 factor (ECF subfamily)
MESRSERVVTETDVQAALTRVVREDSGRVLALLARHFSDLDLADESVQDALTEAARTWPQRGIPDNPAGWLLTVARNKAIDRLRRVDSERRRTLGAARDLLPADIPPVGSAGDEKVGGDDMTFDDQSIGDEQLRLVLLCCHPALDRDTQVALTLRLVGGLTTPEIAAAFLLPTATLAQRIVRAKRKIRDAGIPLSIPADLGERIGSLLGVLYLIFNEGYLARGDREGLVRVDLMQQAIRLTRLANELLPDDAEIEGLLALELFHSARGGTRTNGTGDLILLADQDRTLWDLPAIEQANALLGRAMARMRPGPFQMQAVIAAHHANARTAADTDWPTIVGLYRQLLMMNSSPVIALNHAVAVAMADGPIAGLALLDQLDGLDNYHLYHAARGELLLRCDDSRSRAAFGRARYLAENPSEQRHLDRRLVLSTEREDAPDP